MIAAQHCWAEESPLHRAGCRITSGGGDSKRIVQQKYTAGSGNAGIRRVEGQCKTTAALVTERAYVNPIEARPEQSVDAARQL